VYIADHAPVFPQPIEDGIGIAAAVEGIRDFFHPWHLFRAIIWDSLQGIFEK